MGDHLRPPPPPDHGPRYVVDPRYEERRPRRRRSRSRPIIYEDPLLENFVLGMDGLEVAYGRREGKEKKKEDKPPMPVEKPGTVVEYECYCFKKLGDTWLKADRQHLEVPQSQLEKSVKQYKQSQKPTVFAQLTKMNNFRREQINRLVRDRQDKEKSPYFEWQCAFIQSKDAHKKKDGKMEYLNMDVILTKSVRKLEETAPAKPKKPPGPDIAGELIDLSEPPEKKKNEEEET